MLPLVTYRRLSDDGGAERAPDHPLYDVLHDQPNDYQDSFQWRREQMFDLIDHGHAYDWIVPGPRSFCDQLCPIAPTLVTPKQQFTTLPNGAVIPGRVLYDVRHPTTNVTKTFTQDEIFHLRGAGGKGILEYARTSLGTALATESYAAHIFGRGALNGGIIENPGVLDPEASKRMAASFITSAGNWHLPKVLEQGSVFKPNDMSPEDFQMILSRKMSIDDMARWLGVPRTMLENSDPSYGNAEQFDQNFLTYSMGNWMALFEFAIKSQLILDPLTNYAEFTRDAITRAKFLERAQGNVALVNAGIITADEARGTEGRNKRGGKADELREPQNITGKPAAADVGSPPAPEPRRPLPPSPDGSQRKAEAIVHESAARLLRKEITAVQKAAVKYAADGDAFAAWVTDFYTQHATLVQQTLQLTAADADQYCWSQAQQILNGAGWVAALELWQAPGYAAGLAGLAVEDEAA
jgi:HK97 family phage portal protein